MNNPKPTKSLAGKTCPLCHEGQFQLVQITHVENVAEGNPITIPNVWVDKCSHCGELVFPGDTVHYIESVVAAETEQLTPAELERIREDFGVATQDEMSEILGLGSKTFHKWESGKQFPTRSMSYYIRVLAEHPQVFEWLTRRAWRSRNRVATNGRALDWTVSFPDLASQPHQTSLRIPSLSAPESHQPAHRNPVRAFNLVHFGTK